MNNLEIIRKHLKEHFSITTIEAFTKYQICHLAKYIQLLKNELGIKSIWLKSEKRKKNFKLYYISNGVEK